MMISPELMVRLNRLFEDSLDLGGLDGDAGP